MPARTGAWIAGCIRDGKEAHGPTEAVCKCDSDTGKEVDTHWGCGGGVTGESAYEHIGVMSWSKCFEVGEPGFAGYWIGQASVLNLSAAMCCE